MFEFQNEVNEKKFKEAKDINPVLYQSNTNNTDFYVLVDEPLARGLLTKLEKIISSIAKGKDYTIISALPFTPKEKDLKKKIVELYGMNGTKLSDYIKPNSNVLTIGRALYGVTKGDDLCVEGFYDTIEWQTSFYAPELKSHIFPCPFLFSWLEKDTFERFFSFKQIEFASTNKYHLQRVSAPDLVYLDTKEKVTDLLNNRIAYTGVTSFDLETKGLDPWAKNGKIVCLTLSFEDDPYKAYFLPFNLIDIKLLNAFFSNKKLIGNNIKYDIKWLVVKACIDRYNLHIYWDNMKSSHAINELQFNSLKSDAWLYTPYGGYDFELELYKIKFPACAEDYSLIPTNILFPYAAMDACVSMLCYIQHQIEIDKLDKICPLTNGWSLRRALTDIAFPAIETFTDIELEGMVYDWDKLGKLSKELLQEIDRRKKELYKVLDMPESINIDSGDQLGEFLEKRGWENPGRSKKGLYLTNDASMLYWKKKGHKEVDLLREYTEYNTVMKTFVGVEKDEKGNPTGFYQYRSSDNKIHGSYRTMMADTWRGKSYDPNLQNIIKMSTTYLGSKSFTENELKDYRKESKKIKVERDGKLITIDSLTILDTDKNPIPLHIRVRECFTVPSKDYVLSENDGKGLQLRVAASYSHDPVMTDIFLNRGGDMHSRTAHDVFCPNITLDYFIEHKGEKPYKGYRKKAKAINFGLIFGESSRSFASSTLMTEWTLQEAKDYVAENNLETRRVNMYKNLIRNVGPDVIDMECFEQDQLEFSYYWASADDIRNKFFETYKGLKEWHDKQHAFTKQRGYAQSLWGPIRRIPYLIYQGKDDDGARIKNYENISLNSPVQNGEAMYMMYNMARVRNDFKDNSMKSVQVGNIHDSSIAYLLRGEMQKVREVYLNRFQEPMTPMEGIPYDIELGYSDIVNGEVWGITEHEF